MSVGVEEEEENHAESHKVHVDEKEDAAVVETPTPLHAANGIDGAGDGDERGEDEEQSGAAVGEAGDRQGGGETENDKDAAAYQGTRTRIEKTGQHAILVNLGIDSMPLRYLGATGAVGVAVADGADDTGEGGGVVGGGRFFTSEVATSTAPK